MVLPQKSLYARSHSDSTDYDDQITLEEELISVIRSNLDTEEQKLQKINELIKRGVNINFQDPSHNHNTSLHIAVSKKQQKVIELLLEHKAEVIKNDRHKTPLDIAIRIGNHVIINKLQDYSLPKLEPSGQQTSIEGQPMGQKQPEQKENKVFNIKSQSENRNGNIPLHVAVQKGYKEIVAFLLEQPGIQTDIKNNDDKNPLDLAESQNNQEIINVLEPYLEDHNMPSVVDTQQPASPLTAAH